MWSLIIFSSFVISANAIMDDACVENGMYTEHAVSCKNKYSDDACLMHYKNLTAVQAGGKDERPVECFNGTNGPDAGIKQMAIDSCAKTCGFCCKTKEFDCENAPYPRTPCANVTKEMCDSVYWKPILVKDCPAACGFCKEGGCVDIAPHCDTQPSICLNKGMQIFVAEKCKRTCNLCDATSVTATTAAPSSGSTGSSSPGNSCVDKSTYCPTWVRNGFCRNSQFPTEHKKKYCARSCNLC